MLTLGCKIQITNKDTQKKTIFSYVSNVSISTSIETLTASVKYEYVYLSRPETGEELYRGLANYFQDYNTLRRHQFLEERSTPAKVYFAKAA